MSDKKHVLILIKEHTSPNDKNWSFFRDKVSESIGPDVEVTMGALVDLTFELSANGSSIYDNDRGFSLADFDLVVFRLVRREFARVASCASFLQEKGIPYIDTAVKPHPWSKYSAQAMRQQNGFANIPSVYSSNSKLVAMVQEDKMPIAYPLIIKDNNGKKGRYNFIAHSKEDALRILEDNTEVDFIIQQFIPNNGDYRFLIMGEEVKLIIYRQASDGSHLNNTSQGASASIVESIDFSEEAMDDVIKAAKLERLEVAGVDLMIDRDTGQHYIIEVNSSPQLATGANPDLKMKAYTDYLRQIIDF